MIGVAVALLVNCAEPRMDFRTFYERQFGHWPGMRGEEIFNVQQRVAEASANYIDYVVAYKVKCESDKK